MCFGYLYRICPDSVAHGWHVSERNVAGNRRARCDRVLRTDTVAIFSVDLSPALIVGHDYFDLFLGGIAAAVGAGDGSRIDASVAATLPLCSKLHMMIIYNNPVWRCIPTSATKHWFIAGHAECAGAKR